MMQVKRPSGPLGALTQAFGKKRHANQIRQARSAHLRHEIGAIDFDGARADAKVIGDCLVRLPGHEPVEHLSLTP